MSEESLDILVVEDRPKYVRAAQKFFRQRDDLNASYISDPDTALSHIQKGDYDGALLDVFMSADEKLANQAFRKVQEKRPDPRTEKAFYKSLEAIRDSLGEEAPVGVLLGEEASERQLPHVFVTSMTHHAKKFESVFEYFCDLYGGRRGIPLYEGWQGEHVLTGYTLDHLKDKPERNKDHPEFWKEAFNKLEERGQENE